jgi:hypothetical protein
MRTVTDKVESVIDTLLEATDDAAALKKNCRGGNRGLAVNVADKIDTALRVAGLEPDPYDSDVSNSPSELRPTRHTPTPPYIADPIILLEHTLA